MLDLVAKGISPGIGDGLLYNFEIYDTALPDVKIDNTDEETAMLENAHATFLDTILHNKQACESSEQKKRLESHIETMQGEEMKKSIIATIKDKKICAGQAVKKYFEEKAKKEEGENTDLNSELCLCLLYYTAVEKLKAACNGGEGRLVVQTKAPLYGFVIDEVLSGISAVIILESDNCEAELDIFRHAQIACISLKNEDYEKLKEGERTLLDGQLGTVVQNPDPSTLSGYAQKRLQNVQNLRRTQIMKGIAATTKSGISVDLVAEISGISGARAAIDNDSEGIGILKTNLLRIKSDRMMTSDELYNYLRDILLLNADKNVGVTLAPKGAVANEQSANKGNVGCKQALENTIFEDMSAWREKLFSCLLRTSAYGKLSILPLYTSEVQDIADLRKEIVQITKNLRDKNFVISDRVRIGTVINTAASATITDLIAQESDYIVIDAQSLAKNILQHRLKKQSIQSGELEKHPAVLRTIAQVIRMAQNASLPTAIFGFNTNDTSLVAFIVGLRISSICVLPHEVTPIKRTVRALTQEDCRTAMKKHLQLPGQK